MEVWQNAPHRARESVKKNALAWASVWIAGAAFVLALSGCGKSVESTENALLQGDSEYSYQAWDNGCDTGYHEFPTIEQFCAGLKDNVLNHYCAVAARKKFFQTKGCPGTF